MSLPGSLRWIVRALIAGASCRLASRRTGFGWTREASTEIIDGNADALLAQLHHRLACGFRTTQYEALGQLDAQRIARKVVHAGQIAQLTRSAFRRRTGRWRRSPGHRVRQPGVASFPFVLIQRRPARTQAATPCRRSKRHYPSALPRSKPAAPGLAAGNLPDKYQSAWNDRVRPEREDASTRGQRVQARERRRRRESGHSVKSQPIQTTRELR